MKINRRYNVSILLGMLLCITACTKYQGYYEYENTEKVFNGNSLAYLQSKPGVFDSVLLVLDRLPYLKDAVANEKVTVFAPTNSTFQTALSNLNLVRDNQKKEHLSIQNLDIAQLDTLMTKYIGAGIVTTDSTLYIDGLFIETYGIRHPMHAQRIKENASGLVNGGAEIMYYSDTKNNSFQSQWIRASSQAVNIFTGNGVVHVLGGRHEFGFGDFLTRMNK
ncbi:hypothetical protein GCM10022218_36930 [Sphingobacterium ginsenosidimutans]